MPFSVPGATVEVSMQGYAIIRHCGHVFFAKLGIGDAEILEAVEKARVAVAEHESIQSVMTEKARKVRYEQAVAQRALAAGAGE
jgi:hypothetical protein